MGLGSLEKKSACVTFWHAIQITGSDKHFFVKILLLEKARHIF